MRIAISVSEKEKLKGEESRYVQALRAVGVGPEEIEVVTAADSARADAGRFDGILFAGGEDVDPSFYQEEKRHVSVRVNRDRDEFEFSLLDHALHRRLPVLAICRGIQMVNVKFGGTLYQDLNSEASVGHEHHQSGPRSEATHPVVVSEPNSLLGEAFAGNCPVNSLHHQAIKNLGRGLKRTAYSDDGLCEAVESADDYPFLLAVQWHPEEMVDHPEQCKIFERFVAKCREAAATRK
jgi:putative glutamine amidotransferase